MLREAKGSYLCFPGTPSCLCPLMSLGPLVHGGEPPCAPTQTGTPPPSVWLLPTTALLYASGRGAALCLTTQLSFACLQKKGKPSKASCCTKTRFSVSSLSKFVRRQDQPAATRPACQHQGRKFTWTKTLAASCPAGTAAGGALPATSAEAVVDFSCAALSSSSSQSANAHLFISLILLTHPLDP